MKNFTLASLLVVSTLAALPARTAAAATCAGASCNGLTPQETGCDVGAFPIASDAIALRHPIDNSILGPQVGVIELWSSPACGTVYAVGRNQGGFGFLQIGLTARTDPDSAVSSVTSVESATEPTLVSRMWTPATQSDPAYFAGAFGLFFDEFGGFSNVMGFAESFK